MIPVLKTDGKRELEFLEQLNRRNGEVNKAVADSVAQIIEDVRTLGDKAVLDYTLKFDGKLPPSIEVPREEINDC